MKSIRIYFKQFSFFFAIRLSIIKIVNHLLMKNTKQFYSQTGEDINMAFYLDKPNGFFVDIGCNQPVEFSNTFDLYKRGWTGLNVDANPDLIKKYTIRPNDISVCEAVSDEPKEMIFHEFDQPGVSTLDESVLEEWKKNWKYKGSRKVITKTLTQIFKEHSIKNQIDFMSVDVEGYDFQALITLDFKQYQPKYILVEMHKIDFNNYKSDKIVDFLDKNGYDLIGFIVINGYFKLRE
jgi:FkbM family methyltransferase